MLSKKVYSLDVERGVVEDLTSEISKLEHIRHYRLMLARDAKSFGVLVTTKSGQNQLIGNAADIKSRLEKEGKSATIIFMDEITSEKLLGVRCDAFINTACPRIADMHWDKPLVNASDLDKVLQ